MLNWNINFLKKLKQKYIVKIKFVTFFGDGDEEKE